MKEPYWTGVRRRWTELKSKGAVFGHRAVHKGAFEKCGKEPCRNYNGNQRKDADK